MINFELNYSLENQKPISIVYMKGLEIIQRKIQVRKIEKDYIKAFDYDKSGFRTFKKDNILSAIDLKAISKRQYKTKHRFTKSYN